MLYKIISDKDHNGRIYLPKDFSNVSEHESSSFTKICIGLKECSIQVFIDSALERDEIKISGDLIDNLSIPQDLSYQIKCTEEAIVLGPVIGLLLDKNNARTEKRLNKYLPYTEVYNKIGGLLYVFSLEGINYDDRIIEGFYYSPDTSNWIKAVLPFPQAIFRRIYMSNSAIKKLQDATGGKMFNHNYINKWEFWNTACKYPQLTEHLPDTKLLESISDIDDMFKSFDTLLLKLVRGTLGKGLVRVEKNNDQYIFTEKDLEKPVLTCSRDEASKYISDILQHSKYIIQQYIDLLKFEDRYSDFRVIMQKDDSLNWHFSGIVASMGEPGGISSNYPNSRYLSFEDFFSTYLSLTEIKVRRKKRKILSLCKSVCKVLDLEKGNYGDVGIDIGIDNSLKPWIFEVNGRHYHIMPLLISDLQTFIAVKSNPVKYAAALSGFSLL